MTHTLRILPDRVWPDAPQRILNTVDSTQKELQRWFQEQPWLPEGTMVLAYSQCSGHGRHGREWQTAPDSLAMSVLLRPTLPNEQVHWLAAATGVAVCAALRELDAPARLKWPNDILYGSDKAGGILAQLWELQEERPIVAIGIGLNLSQNKEWFVTRGLQRATSVAASTGTSLETLQVAQKVYAWLNVKVGILQESGPQALLEEYLSLLADSGRKVRVRNPDGSSVVGKVEGVSIAGELLVCTASGTVESVCAGIIEWELHEPFGN